MAELVPSLDEVLEATSNQSGIPIKSLKMAKDHKTLRWRHIGIYVARKHNYSSLNKIAIVFGYNNHSPAYYAVRRIDDDFDKYEDDVNAVKAKLGITEGG